MGGSCGAGLRWLALDRWPVDGGGFPWVVLVVNLLGSLALGVLLTVEWSHPRAQVLVRDAGAVGLCGGLTTFSTYAVEVVDLLDRGRAATAVAYTVASIVGALAAVVAGAAAGRRIRWSA